MVRSVLFAGLLWLVASSAAAQRAPEADSLDAATADLLPDRTAEALGGLLLVSGDEPELLPLDYRGTGGIQPVVDGLRVSRTDGLPQEALLSLAVPTGYVSPRLGGALGAFVEVETRDAPRDDLGRAEGTGGLDAYGYGRATVGAGVSQGIVRFYGAGSFERADDFDPRAYGTPALPADELQALREAPQVIRVDRALADAAGFDPTRARYTTEDTYYVPLPPSLQEGTPDALASALGLSDPNAILQFQPVQSLALRNGEVPLQTAAPVSEGDRLRGHLALEVAPADGLRLRFSGQGVRETGRAFQTGYAFAAPEMIPATRDEAWRGMAEADLDVGGGTLALAASAERAISVQHDARFSDAIGDLIRYGDIDDPANAAAANYRNYFGSYVPAYADGQITLPLAYGAFAWVGQGPLGYARETASTIQFAASYRRRVGAVDLMLGAEREQQTQRGVTAPNPISLARFVDDGRVETPLDLDGDGHVDGGITRYAELPASVATLYVSAYGYDYLGLDAVSDGTAVADYAAALADNTLALAPRRPAYTAGFAEGTWEQGGLTLRGGLRVARFSSNANALADPFATVAIYRAEDLAGGSITDPVTGRQVQAPAGGVPDGIPGSAALYVSGSQVVGYRDLEGAFYDATGAAVSQNEVFGVGSPVAVGESQGELTAEVLADAPTSIRVLPRVQASFRAPAGTIVSAFVNAFARQPDPAQAFPSLTALDAVRQGGGLAAVANGALRPETLTEAGVDARQAFGREGAVRGEIGATLFVRRYGDRIRVEERRVAFPTNYTTYTNGESATVPGATLRARAEAGRLGARVAVSARREPFEAATPFASGPLVKQVVATDATALLTLATEPMDGPALGSLFPLGNVRFGAVLRVASGDPYLGRSPGSPLVVPFEDRPVQGGVQHGPARSRLDLRLGRAFRLGASSLEVVAEVINVLGRTNAIRVYPTTGLPDDDGFLATDPAAIRGLSTEIEQEAYRALYAARVQDPLNVGRPRMLRLGLRLDL